MKYPFFILEIGTLSVPYPPRGLYPAVGMHSDGEEVRLDLDAVWETKFIPKHTFENRNDAVLARKEKRKSTIRDVTDADSESPARKVRHERVHIAGDKLR